MSIDVRVQVPSSAPARRKRHIACDEFFISLQNSSRAHFAAPRFQTGPAVAGLRFGDAAARRFFLSQGNIDVNRPFHVVAKFALRPRFFMFTVKRHHPHGAVFHRQASRGVFPLYRRDGTDLQEAQPRPPEKTGKGLQAGAEYGIIAEDAARRGRRGTANREMYPSG